MLLDAVFVPSVTSSADAGGEPYARVVLRTMRRDAARRGPRAERHVLRRCRRGAICQSGPSGPCDAMLLDAVLVPSVTSSADACGEPYARVVLWTMRCCSTRSSRRA